MITVSDAWLAAHEQTIVPESFVEIKCGLVDPEARSLAETTSTDEATFSNTAEVTQNDDIPEGPKYATLEENLWVLDGSRSLLPDYDIYATPGYVSSGDQQEAGQIVISFPDTRDNVIPGLTITWSSEFDEYATDFTISVSSTTHSVSGNTSVVSVVDLELTGYDSLTITVSRWSHPSHRVRIDQVVFGQVLTLDKNDIIIYEHEQTGSLVSGEVPKNSVSFTINNVDGRWNPLNPTGVGKYLSERQEIVVRYGQDVGGTVEWIPAGTFYLSEWTAPANGLEASFTARDIIEFMQNVKFTAGTGGSLWEVANNALAEVTERPENMVVNLDGSLDSYYPLQVRDFEHTVPEVLQMCANAGLCVMWCDREGALNIAPHDETNTGYTIARKFSYAHPEVTLSKPLKSITVNWYETEEDLSDPYQTTIGVNSKGEVQSVDNQLVSTSEQAYDIAYRIECILSSRKTVSGEFRANPILDLYDVVSVESKYGTIENVALTKIKYSYTGSFQGTYEGRVI